MPILTAMLPFRNLSVDVETPLDLVAAHAGLARAGIEPLYDIVAGASAAPCRLVHRDAGPAAVRRRGRGLVVDAPVALLGAGEPLFDPLTTLMERELNLAGGASMVAAGVALPGGAVVLFGPSGSGKTSTALALCSRFDGRLVGGDRCVFGYADGCVQAVAGSRAVLARPDALRRNVPEFAADLPTQAGPHWRKHRLSRGVAIAGRPVQVRSVCFVTVDDRVPLSYGPADPARARYLLHENASRLVRASAAAFLSADGRSPLGWLPSLDTEACHRSRVRLVEALAGAALDVCGPQADVAEVVAGTVPGA